MIKEITVKNGKHTIIFSINAFGNIHDYIAHYGTKRVTSLVATAVERAYRDRARSLIPGDAKREQLDDIVLALEDPKKWLPGKVVDLDKVADKVKEVLEGLDEQDQDNIFRTILCHRKADVAKEAANDDASGE